MRGDSKIYLCGAAMVNQSRRGRLLLTCNVTLRSRFAPIGFRVEISYISTTDALHLRGEQRAAQSPLSDGMNVGKYYASNTGANLCSFVFGPFEVIHAIRFVLANFLGLD
jgi:hypothetical protein